MERARRIIWSPTAREDLIDIWGHFARVASPEVADKLLHEIERTFTKATLAVAFTFPINTRQADVQPWPSPSDFTSVYSPSSSLMRSL